MVNDLNRIEAPVTARGYLLCGFAAFGGILYGYDSGYISGGMCGSNHYSWIALHVDTDNRAVLAMTFFKKEFGGVVPLTNDGSGYNIATWQKSLITSILSAGTFFGALFAGFVADWIGRRLSLMYSCVVFSVGVVLQVASTSVGLLVAGRIVAGFGVGLVSAIVIMYMSEVAPKGIRGAIVSGYQWAITIGKFFFFFFTT